MTGALLTLQVTMGGCGDRGPWTPPVPGITAPGSCEEYARDPAKYVYGVERGGEPRHT